MFCDFKTFFVNAMHCSTSACLCGALQTWLLPQMQNDNPDLASPVNWFRSVAAESAHAGNTLPCQRGGKNYARVESVGLFVNLAWPSCESFPQLVQAGIFLSHCVFCFVAVDDRSDADALPSAYMYTCIFCEKYGYLDVEL
ncbi:hypothetical protein BaRGS_00003129 [Batillaria attramentaria]|uniref:Uncharacterized protein n=1 Tax=Batillaria attramentaria TaxID=370345 RepID=A0ABD0M3C2_9CAEN